MGILDGIKGTGGKKPSGSFLDRWDQQLAEQEAGYKKKKQEQKTKQKALDTAMRQLKKEERVEQPLPQLNLPKPKEPTSALEKLEQGLLRFSNNVNKGLFGIDPLKDQAELTKKGILHTPDKFLQAATPADTLGEKVIEGAGQITGMMLPISKSYQATKPLANLLTKSLNPASKGSKYIGDAIKGATAMGTYSTAREGLEEVAGLNDQTLGERAKDIAIETGLGAVGDPLARLAGAGLKKGSQAIKGVYDESLKNAPVSNFSAFAKQIPEKLFPPKQQNRVLDMIDVGGKPEKDRYTFDKFMTDTVDELRPLQKATEKIGGKNVPIEQNPYKQAWLSRGWKGKADAKLEYGITDDAGNKVAKSLKEIIQPIKGKLNEWREYAVALRSKEYARDGLDSGIDPKLVDEAIEKYGADESIVKATKEVRQYIDDMNESTLVKSGIWNKEKLKTMRETHENYIPMNRTREKGIRDLPQSASNKRIGNQKDPTKQRTGSKRPIIDPLESITKQTYKNTAIAEKNNVMKSLIELAEKNPDNAIVRPVKADQSALDSVQKSLDEFIMNPTDNLEQQLKDTLKLFEPQTVNGKKNVFTVMRNGKAEQWEIADDELAKVIGGLNNENVGFLAELLGKPTGALKAGLVLAPEFVIKNLVRDQASAFINSKYGFIPYWDFFRGLSSAMKKDDIYYKWMSSGGAQASWVSLERDYLQGQIRTLTKSGIDKISKNPLEWLRKFSELSEQATRLGEFKKGLKKGEKKNLPADRALQESTLAARDVTLDFSRIGAKTKGINRAVAFFNVAVQSMDKMVRQFKEHPARTTAKSVAFITLPSVLLYAINYRDPKYQELPQWERDTYWHIPAGDTFVKIPKPFELGIIFGTYVERQLQFSLNQDPKAFEDFAKTVAGGFTPSVIPTLFMPWIEAFANKDQFTGAPIVPKREENLLKPDQYGAYTSETAKYIGRKIDQSPRIIDNYITGYTGTLGKHTLANIDNLSKELGFTNPPPKPDRGLSDIPGISPFISKSLEGSSKSLDDFYKERDKLTRERNSAKKNEMSYEKEAEFKKYNKIAEAIGKEQKQVREVLDAMTITPEQKRDKLKQLNLNIINLARKAKGLPPIE